MPIFSNLWFNTIMGAFMKHLFISIFLLCLGNIISAQTISADYQDGVIYIKFKDKKSTPNYTVKQDNTVSISEMPFLQQIKTAYGITKITSPFSSWDKENFSGVIYIYYDSIAKVDSLIQHLSRLGLFKYIQKEPVFTIFGTPNDPFYTETDNLQWYLDVINAKQAWDIAKGSAGIKVAVVDNAVWGEHPDLQIPSQLQANVTNGTAVVGNSAPPVSVNQDEMCTNPNTCNAYKWSHGTHCAGMIGAITNNRTGIASLGGGVTIMGISTSKDGSTVAYSREGVMYAKNNGAKVISMSYGGSTADSLSRELFQSCYDAGIVLVAAAGNNGTNRQSYPAAYLGVISVAAANSDNHLPVFLSMELGLVLLHPEVLK